MLEMPSAGMAKRVVEQGNASLLREAVKEVLGVEWAIRCESPSGSPPPAAASARPNLTVVRDAPPTPDDDVPDDYDAGAKPQASGDFAVHDPEAAAIELLTRQLGARRLDPDKS